MSPVWRTVSVASSISYHRSAEFVPLPATACTAQRLPPTTITLPTKRGATFSIVSIPSPLSVSSGWRAAGGPA